MRKSTVGTSLHPRIENVPDRIIEFQRQPENKAVRDPGIAILERDRTIDQKGMVYR